MRGHSYTHTERAIRTRARGRNRRSGANPAVWQRWFATCRSGGSVCEFLLWECRPDDRSCRRPGVSLRVDEGASPCPAGPMISPDVDGLLVVTPGALDTGVIMPADLSGHTEDHRPGRKPSAQAGAGFTLPEAMTGRARPHRAPVGDKPGLA